MARTKKPRGNKTPNLTNNQPFESVVEVVKLSANDPMVIDQTLAPVSGQGIVSYGSADTQFAYLYNLYLKSVTHNAICDSISQMVYGNGLNIEGIIDPEENKRVVKDSVVYGNAALQVTEQDIFHIPVNFIRANEVNPDNNKVEWYWYSTDFEDAKIDPVKFPAWSPTWKPDEDYPIAIHYIKTYNSTSIYYGIPDFQGGLSYMEQEIEIANFLLKYIKNNFSVTTLININSGAGDPQSRRKMRKEILDNLTGPGGELVITAFNKNKDFATTIENVTISDAAEQYRYMSENARAQIVVAHQVVSPLLVGIRDTATGFSSNAEELAMSRALMEEMKIKPKQELISAAYDYVKGRTDIAFVSSVGDAAEVIPEEVIELKKASPESEAKALIDLGETKLEGFKLMVSAPVDYTTEETDDLSLGEDVQMASTGTARPNAASSQDNEDVKVRYRYRGNKVGERDFCNLMINADKLYRKEDIIMMGNNPRINPGFGPYGTNTYSIWLYKGGVNCYHQWFREIYVRNGVNVDVNSPLAQTISTSQARREGYDIETNNTLVSIKPINMPNQGALN